MRVGFKGVLIVVAYDIEDDKKRTKVMKVLKNYGQWMQYSVFECNLNKEQFLQLQRRLSRLVNADVDSLRYYVLCESCQAKVIRIGGVRVRDETMFLV